MISGVLAGAAGEPIAWDHHPCHEGGSRPVVLVAHGFKGFKDWGFFPNVAAALAERFHVVRFNFSHDGVGLGPDARDFTRLDLFRRNRASYELLDSRRLLDGIQGGLVAMGPTVDRTRVGLLGHSRGGANVILAASGRPEVRAVATWAAVSTLALPDAAVAAFRDGSVWEVQNARTGQVMLIDRTAYEDVTPIPPHLDLEIHTPLLGERLLIVHGTRDTSVPVAAAHHLHTLTGGRATLGLIADADHVFNGGHPFRGRTPQLEAAIAATISHFSQHL